MAYISTIPEATDRINQSQAQIKENFTQLKNLIDVNHVTFGGAAGEGKHIFVTFTDQTASGAPATAGTDIDMYNLLVGANQELHIKKAGGTGIPFTQSAVSSARGWTYLPSGAIMVWGRETGWNTASQAFNFNTGLATLPTFTNASPMVQLTRIRSSTSGSNTQVWLSSTTTTNFTVQRSTSTTTAIDFAWLAIGF